mmetsp:Transcript_5835/g.9693  ORF Transcript_5835/g.9693 Transcript_5835/m.9693 type:complete len:233 (-) Transcript_5835:43-741(-)
MDLLEAYSSDEEDTERSENCPKGCVEVVSIHDVPADTFERSLPHVRGNWAGHIFSPLTGDWTEKIDASIENFRNALELAGWSGTVVTQTARLHVSCSRPFFLQLASVDSFMRELRASLSHERALAIQIDKEIILSNDEGTRSFFGWKLDSNPALARLVRELDAIMVKYNQKPYYDPPVFHISLASIQDEIPAEALRYLQDLQEDNVFDSLVHIRQISCTVGTTKRVDISLLQ